MIITTTQSLKQKINSSSRMSICFIRLGHHDQPIFRYLLGQFSQMVAKYSDITKFLSKFKDQPRIVLKCFIIHKKYLNTHSISVR